MPTRDDVPRHFESLSLVYQLTELPVRVFECAADGSAQTLFALPEFPEILKLRLPVTIERNLASLANSGMEDAASGGRLFPMVYTEGDELALCCVPFPLADGSLCAVTLGPCFLRDPLRPEIQGARIKRPSPDGCFRDCDAEEAAIAARAFPYRELRYAHAAVRLVYGLLFGRSLDLVDLLAFNASSDAYGEIPALTGEELFERREENRFHMPYSVERELWDLVRQGATDKIRLRLETQAAWGFGIIAKNTLRQEKNMLIAATTLATRAAIDGGVPDEIAYALSDGVIRTAEDLSDVEGVALLNNRMVMNFAELVVRYKNGSGRSREISLCVDYVNKHLFDDVSLEILSDMVNLSPSQISRKFRKETGTSIVEYVQSERVREASNMLLFSPRTIPEIANCLNFGSQSYFTAVFRKHTGMTPAEFRRGKR